MKQEKLDRRKKYTRMVIQSSLLDLMTQKPIHKISISELCEVADINRGTFYLHYAKVNDILKELEDQLMDQFMGSISKINSSNQLVMLTALIGAIEKNAALCKVLFSVNGDPSFILNAVKTYYAWFVKDYVKDNPKTNEPELGYLYSFFVSGAIGLIESWLKQGLKTSAQDIGAMLNRLYNLTKKF